MLAKSILDNLWQSGFCKRLIETLKRSQPGDEGAQERIYITTRHIAEDHCRHCRYANTIRSVEHDTAYRLGDAAFALFQHGDNVRNVPRFKDVFQQVMNLAIASGRIDRAIMQWISERAIERAGKPYPYADDDSSQPN